jgi:membrane fusion protein (multidrug efflux system)
MKGFVMFKKNLLVIVCLSLIGIAACSKKDDDHGAPPVFVTTAPVKTIAWQKSVQATGTLQAIQGAQLKSEVSGRVTKIYFKAGQVVHAGDPLIDINPSILLAQYNAAQANAQLQAANFQRAKKLYQQKIISKADYDNAFASAASTKSLADAAAANLAQARVKAPFDGTAGINLVNVGDYVALGVPLLNLQQLNKLRVDFSVPELYAGMVKVGDKVKLTIGDTGDTAVTGQVIGIDSAIDQTTRMLALQGIVSNDADHHLLPGGYTQVTLYYGPGTNYVEVPQTAVVDEDASHKVYILEGQKAKEIPIEVGERVGDQVIVKSGLKPSQVIITSGLIKLHDGASVIDEAAMAKMQAAKKQ